MRALGRRAKGKEIVVEIVGGGDTRGARFRDKGVSAPPVGGVRLMRSEFESCAPPSAEVQVAETLVLPD